LIDLLPAGISSTRRLVTRTPGDSPSCPAFVYILHSSGFGLCLFASAISSHPCSVRWYGTATSLSAHRPAHLAAPR
jgi:hypothetical protein